MSRKESRYGVAVSQAGIPLRRAADYQRLLDDRWPYFDIALDIEIKATMDASTTATVKIAEHDLGYLPMFVFRDASGYVGTEVTRIIATEKSVYAKMDALGSGPIELLGRLKVFAVDCSEGVNSEVTDITPYESSINTDYGVKILRNGSGNRRINSPELSNFSVNTDAKALAIHQSGIQHFNPWADNLSNTASATSINTSTDIITISSAKSWMTTGTAITYRPNDFFTNPSPLSGATYYLIQMSPTTYKLASTEPNAFAGTAIDLTTAGSLPGTITADGDYTNDTSTRIYHNLGYPPTYLIAKIYESDSSWSASFWNGLDGESFIESMDSLAARAYATTQYIQFKGVQEVISGKHAYVIIKDPSEVAA